jgi:hypothetical protein
MIASTPLTLTFQTRQSRYWRAMSDFYRSRDRFLHEMLKREGDGQPFATYRAADGSTVPCRLTGVDLRQHALLLGATGAGKSSLLEAMARTLLGRGHAFAVIDPHGDLARRIEGWARTSGNLKVVSLDFARAESLPSWNPLLPLDGVDVGRQVDLLVSVLKRLYAADRAASWAWGVKVEEIVRMALRGSIESEVPVTLADLERFLLDPRYRKEVLATAGEEVTHYFLHRFGPQEQMYVSAVVNKLSPFLGSTAVRRFLGSGGEPVDLLSLPDRPVALIVNLARGALGSAADVLGRLLVNVLLLSALRRERAVPETRRHFALLVDEAHSFAGTEGGLEDLLVTGRKFHFALTLASQGLSLFPAHLRPLLLGNTARQFFFRLPYAEARLLGPDVLEPLGNVSRRAIRPYDDLSDPLLSAREEMDARTHELADLPCGACYWSLRGRRFKARRIQIDRPPKAPRMLSAEAQARMALSEIEIPS